MLLQINLYYGQQLPVCWRIDCGGVKFLFAGANCVIEKVSDISDVAEVQSDDGKGEIVKCVEVGEIDGVLSLRNILVVYRVMPE